MFFDVGTNKTQESIWGKKKTHNRVEDLNDTDGSFLNMCGRNVTSSYYGAASRSRFLLPAQLQGGRLVLESRRRLETADWILNLVLSLSTRFKISAIQLPRKLSASVEEGKDTSV